MEILALILAICAIIGLKFTYKRLLDIRNKVEKHDEFLFYLRERLVQNGLFKYSGSDSANVGLNETQDEIRLDRLRSDLRALVKTPDDL